MQLQALPITLRECVSCRRCFDSTTQYCPDCYIELRSLDSIPRLIKSRYRLETMIARGAYGMAFAGRDQVNWNGSQSGREILVKIIRNSVIGDARVQEQFFQETERLAKLSHPQIHSLVDCGMLADDMVWMAYERVQAESLRQVIRRLGKIRIEEAVDMIAKIASALDIAHEAGLFHYDLKPECISVQFTPALFRVHGVDMPPPPNIRLIDFGMALLTGLRPVTGQKIVLLRAADRNPGTQVYRSPGMLRGEESDRQMDVYSLGAIAWEMLTGTPPPAHGDGMETATPALRDLTPEAHPLLEAAITKALDGKSWQRQATAAEFCRDLLRYTRIAAV
ncbi:MAG: serine/threonine-protein kinase [Blastocatellia bacterium]